MITGNTRVSTFEEPTTQLLPVTPSDSTILPQVVGIGYPRRLYVGASGDVTLLGIDDTVPVLLKSVPIGTLNIRASKVMLTGTTATSIVALY